jgi:hypothetical protein
LTGRVLDEERKEAMTTTEQERQDGTGTSEIQNLRKDMEVQAATQAGETATQAATHAGTWSAMIAGAAGLVVGMFLAIGLMAAARNN